MECGGNLNIPGSVTVFRVGEDAAIASMLTVFLNASILSATPLRLQRVRLIVWNAQVVADLVCRGSLMSPLRKQINQIGLVGILSCFASWCAVAQQTPVEAEHPATGQADPSKALASNRVEAAELELRRDLERQPNSSALLYQLGVVLQQEGRPTDSLRFFTQAAHFEKPDASQLLSVALDYVLLGDYNDASHWLEVAESLEPQNVEVEYGLGRCLYSLDRFPEAALRFRHVLELKPDHLKAEENLGLAYDMMDEPEKAEEALRKAVTWTGQESKDEWPFLDFGSFLMDHNRAAEAAPLLQRAAAIAPNRAVCHEKLGRALISTRDTDGGVRELEIAAKLQPTNAKTHYELGIIYREAGALGKARAEFMLSQSLYVEHDQKHPKSGC